MRCMNLYKQLYLRGKANELVWDGFRVEKTELDYSFLQVSVLGLVGLEHSLLRLVALAPEPLLMLAQVNYVVCE